MAGFFFRSLLVWAVGVLSAIYLLNPFGGQYEFLQDTDRVFGNLDESVAAILFLSFLRYFGVDACAFFPKPAGDEGDADLPDGGT